MSKSKQATGLPPSKDGDGIDIVQECCNLIATMVGRRGQAVRPNVANQARNDLQRLIRRCLMKHKDDVLYEVLERLARVDDRMCTAFKELVDESSGVMVVRDDDGVDIEVNAFVIPLVIRSQGGLKQANTFRDQAAFETLSASIVQSGLESPSAKVVLVHHAYHPDELDRVSYSELSEMVCEARAALSGAGRGKRSAPPKTQAIERSMAGWPSTEFAADDMALELRYLLGFALKTLKDPFYRVPDEESAMDAYFEARAARFRQWSEDIRPVLRRCLSDPVDETMQIDFLYQDLFHGARERGISEYTILGLMSELGALLEQSDLDLAQLTAVIAPDVDGSDAVLRVNIYRSDQIDDVPLASAEKPLVLGFDLEAEIQDLADALASLGIEHLAIAAGYDEDGRPEELRNYP